MLATIVFALTTGAAIPHQGHPAQPAQPAMAARTDSLFRAGLAAESYAAAIAHVTAAPGDFHALWRAARAEVIRGINSTEPAATKAGIYRLAEGYARQAIAVEPGRVDGHYWLAAATGRRAWVEGMFAAARLAQETHTEALRTLAIDSLHAGARAILGKLNSDAMSLNPAARFIASRLLGASALRAVSWENAEREFHAAIAHDPFSILSRLDLVQALQRMGRLADADAAASLALALPVRTPADTAFRRILQNARREIAQVRGR